MKKTHKIYLWVVIGISLMASVSVHAFDVRSNQPVTTETQEECDSLFITGGKGYAVKNITMTEKNVSFVVCDSTENKIRKVAWTQVLYVKKADGRIITADKVYENDTPEEKLEKQVKNLLVISIISFFLGLSLIIGIIVWIKAAKYRKKIHGHPKEKKLNKQLNWAVGLSFILILKFILSIILIIYAIKHAFDNLFNWNFDFNYNDDPQ